MQSRIRLGITVAVVAATAALFIATPGAVAVDFQPVLAGANNTATFGTLIVNSNSISLSHGDPLQFCRQGLDQYPEDLHGFSACGDKVGVEGFAPGVFLFEDGIGVRGNGYTGVNGDGTHIGVFGSGPEQGVWGASVTGDAVLGQNTGSTGIGVHGKTGGTGSAVFGEATGHGLGVFAKSTNGTGLRAESDAIGGFAVNASAMNGQAAIAVQGVTQTGTGVFGTNLGTSGIGVYGKTGGAGTAVYGEATTSGVGILGKTVTGTALRGDSSTDTGTALQVNGKASFSRSGVIRLGSFADSVIKGGVPMTSASYVLATLQTNTSGLVIQAAVPNPAGFFTIYFNRPAPVGTRVAWFVVN
jgi:hypothetical protein